MAILAAMEAGCRHPADPWGAPSRIRNRRNGGGVSPPRGPRYGDLSGRCAPVRNGGGVSPPRGLVALNEATTGPPAAMEAGCRHPADAGTVPPSPRSRAVPQWRRGVATPRARRRAGAGGRRLAAAMEAGVATPRTRAPTAAISGCRRNGGGVSPPRGLVTPAQTPPTQAQPQWRRGVATRGRAVDLGPARRLRPQWRRGVATPRRAIPEAAGHSTPRRNGGGVSPPRGPNPRHAIAPSRMPQWRRGVATPRTPRRSEGGRAARRSAAMEAGCRHPADL